MVEWREEAESHFQVFKTTHGRDNRTSAGSGLLLKHKGEDMCMHFLFRSVLSPVLWYSENTTWVQARGWPFRMVAIYGAHRGQGTARAELKLDLLR